MKLKTVVVLSTMNLPNSEYLNLGKHPSRYTELFEAHLTAELRIIFGELCSRPNYSFFRESAKFHLFFRCARSVGASLIIFLFFSLSEIKVTLYEINRGLGIVELWCS